MTSPLFVERRGQGKPLLVLGGGPGLSHDYLVEPLSALESDFSLVYADYPGCGRSRPSKPAGANETADAVLAFARIEFGNSPFQAICHSFGSWILGAMLARDSSLPVNACVLVSPSPHDYQNCQVAEARLFERFSSEDREFFFAAMNGEIDVRRALMQRLVRYYCGRDTDLPSLAFDVDTATAGSIMPTLGAFDFRTQLNCIPRRLYIFGDRDFISPNDFGDLGGARVRVLSSGHFAFCDAPAAFFSGVTSFLGSM